MQREVLGKIHRDVLSRYLSVCHTLWTEVANRNKNVDCGKLRWSCGKIWILKCLPKQCMIAIWCNAWRFRICEMLYFTNIWAYQRERITKKQNTHSLCVAEKWSLMPSMMEYSMVMWIHWDKGTLKFPNKLKDLQILRHVNCLLIFPK